jgi:hypothetical protein
MTTIANIQIQPNSNRLPDMTVSATIDGNTVTFVYDGAPYILHICGVYWEYKYNGNAVWFVGRDNNPRSFFVRVPLVHFR